MEHITGNLGQSIRNDYGEFVTIGTFRVRKELIIVYANNLHPDHKGIFLILSGGTHTCSPIADDEEIKKTLERLDWIYKKDQQV